MPAARKLLQDLTELDIRAAQWTDFIWSTEYSECSSDLGAFIPRASTRPMGMDLPRSSWVRLNRLRAGVGCFQSSMHKWGLAPTSNCKCGAAEQTTEHIILTCPVHRGTHSNTWTDGFGCRHTMLAEYHHCQHLISKQWIIQQFNNIAVSMLFLTWMWIPSKRRRRSCNNSYSITTIITVIHNNLKSQRLYVSVNLLLFLFVDICQHVFRLR